MPTANYGYTAPLNPPGVSPPLSEKQVWDALLIKVRDAPQFLAVIDSVKVLSEGPAKDGQFPGIAAGTQYITREAVFKSGQGPPDAQRNGGKMVEDCFCYEVRSRFPLFSACVCEKGGLACPWRRAASASLCSSLAPPRLQMKG